MKAGGTTTLFAALSVLDETVIGRYMQLHRHREFICFLNVVEREVPAEKPVHAALDNYTTHKHPKVLTWLSRYPSWTFHLAPTSASSLNVVEDFLFLNDPPTHPPWRAPLDRRFAGRDHADLTEHNASPKPFVWTKSVEAIRAKLDRCPVSPV